MAATLRQTDHMPLTADVCAPRATELIDNALPDKVFRDSLTRFAQRVGTPGGDRPRAATLGGAQRPCCDEALSPVERCRLALPQRSAKSFRGKR